MAACTIDELDWTRVVDGHRVSQEDMAGSTGRVRNQTLREDLKNPLTVGVRMSRLKLEIRRMRSFSLNLKLL